MKTGIQLCLNPPFLTLSASSPIFRKKVDFPAPGPPKTIKYCFLFATSIPGCF